ncbi:unnamed protein product [Vitrella brassicaformis CCMP3155]|uniref:Tubulin beta chain n=1 Tax=Vitrella brassicaformis (strain CCMP3155) TaxID=1169540 RepID=A0A0G4GWU6_VITBC|nr:unnamed protein product [Vitrella brassicaformis CCMP3155]|eukprot:CEM35466.1 unnamed protein product [Vitrella brassicaformis CCMP3155]
MHPGYSYIASKGTVSYFKGESEAVYSLILRDHDGKARPKMVKMTNIDGKWKGVKVTEAFVEHIAGDSQKYAEDYWRSIEVREALLDELLGNFPEAPCFLDVMVNIDGYIHVAGDMVQVGRAGNNISQEFWRDLVEEHHIHHQNFEKTMGTLHGKFCGSEADIYRLQQVGVFFDESSSGRTWQALQTREYLLPDEGSGNCYARAYHTSGLDICDAMTEGVRRMVEGCDCLQGVQLAHSLAGGTGSGLTTLMLNSMQDFFNKTSGLLGPVLQTFTLFTSELASDILVEPYNAVLGLKGLVECCDQVFPFDNHALSSICQQILQINVPRFQHMDDLVARVMSGITCNLRFPGIVDADLRKMHTNLVPFPKTHFLITCTAPLSLTKTAPYRTYSILELTQQMLQPENCVVKCDTLRLDTGEHWRTSRFLPSFATFRGKTEYLATSEINDVLQRMPHTTVYDAHFPDWTPTCLSSCICTVPPAGKQFDQSVTYITNCTAFHEVLERIGDAWDKLYKAKAHLYIYEAEGMEIEEMGS